MCRLVWTGRSSVRRAAARIFAGRRNRRLNLRLRRVKRRERAWSVARRWNRGRAYKLGAAKAVVAVAKVAVAVKAAVVAVAVEAVVAVGRASVDGAGGEVRRPISWTAKRAVS